MQDSILDVKSHLAANVSSNTMPSSKLPIANFNRNTPHDVFLAYFFLTLLHILVSVFYAAFFVFDFGLLNQSTKIAITPKSTTVFILMIVPFTRSLIKGYRSNNLQIPSSCMENDKEWASSLQSAFQKFGKKTQCWFIAPCPDQIAVASQKDFVRYLADPYDSKLACHGQGAQLSYILMQPMINLFLAGLAYGPSEDQRSAMAGFRSFAWYMVMLQLCHTWGSTFPWRMGWLVKSSRVARAVRRQCFTVGEREDVEKDLNTIDVDPKERLRWWIQESWKGCEDPKDSENSPESGILIDFKKKYRKNRQ